MSIQSRINLVLLSVLSLMAVLLGLFSVVDLRYAVSREHAEYMNLVIDHFVEDFLPPKGSAAGPDDYLRGISTAQRFSEAIRGDLLLFQDTEASTEGLPGSPVPVAVGARLQTASRTDKWLHVVGALKKGSADGTLLRRAAGLGEYFVYRHYPRWNWTIICAISDHELATGLIRTVARAVLLWATVLAGAYFLLLAVLRRSLIQPLQQLQVLASSIARGDQPPPFMPFQSDELRELSRSLEQMGIEINQTQLSLQASNRRLEEEVDRRTRRLEEANAALLLEVEERRTAERRLTKSLAEREVLLREVHHRVKNNLLVIYALLEFEKQFHDDRDPTLRFADIQSRVVSIAAIHQSLYRAEDVSSVAMKHYLEELVARLSETLGRTAARISFHVEADDAVLSLDQAVPCGLLVNELVTNSVRHAFPGNREGMISVELRRGPENDCELVVRDNGIGGEYVSGSGGSLGLFLAGAIAEQLGSELVCNHDSGTCCRISFEVESKEDATS